MQKAVLELSRLIQRNDGAIEKWKEMIDCATIENEDYKSALTKMGFEYKPLPENMPTFWPLEKLFVKDEEIINELTPQ